jgi:hypothetical protein
LSGIQPAADVLGDPFGRVADVVDELFRLAPDIVGDFPSLAASVMGEFLDLAARVMDDFLGLAAGIVRELLRALDGGRLGSGFGDRGRGDVAHDFGWQRASMPAEWVLCTPRSIAKAE